MKVTALESVTVFYKFSGVVRTRRSTSSDFLVNSVWTCALNAVCKTNRKWIIGIAKNRTSSD